MPTSSAGAHATRRCPARPIRCSPPARIRSPDCWVWRPRREKWARSRAGPAMSASTTWMLRPIDLRVSAEPCTSRRRMSPMISRFSVVADPQMATLALVKGLKSGQEQPAALSSPGHVGWHELSAVDWEQAFAFYGELFGWQKVDADFGGLGTYLLFSAGGQTIGGMSTKPPTVPMPFWLYYFNVGDIDAAAKRVKAGGGKILEGPARSARRQPDRPMHGSSGRHVRAEGGPLQDNRLFRACRGGRSCRHAFVRTQEDRAERVVSLTVNEGLPVSRHGRAQIDRPAPRRESPVPSFSRTDRYWWCRSRIRRDPCRSP